MRGLDPVPLPPRLAERLLRLLVGDRDVAEGMLGDLQEECVEELGRDASRIRTAAWYWTVIVILGVRYRLASPRRRAPDVRETGVRPAARGRATVLEATRRDVAAAGRKLRRSPGFTAVTVAILAIGIGGTTALFSFVNGVLLKPLPFPEPDRLVGVWLTSPVWGMEWLDQPRGAYFTFREDSRTLEDIAIWDARQVAVRSGGEAEKVPAMMITDGMFGVLGVEPALGRDFTPADDRPGAPLTFLVGHEYWRNRLGGDPAVIGSTLTVDGAVGEVIGVAPPGLRILRFAPAVYFPARWDPSTAGMSDYSYQAIARLRPGVTLQEATDDVGRMIPLVVERYPDGMSLEQVRQARIGPHLRPLTEELVGEVSRPLWLLWIATALVLVIACANVANLLMVRAEGRRREVAVRAAIGASRLQLVRELLLESLGLGLLGGTAGVGVALVGVDALGSILPPEFPRLHEIGIDGTTLLFASGASLLASLLFGILPALRTGRSDAVEGLKEGGAASGTSRRRLTARNTLVVVQVGLALMLVVGSGLMARSYAALRSVDPGFAHPEEVLTFRVNLSPDEVGSTLEVAAFYENVIRAVASLPGVASVSGSNNLPMDGNSSNQGLEIEDYPTGPDENLPFARVKWVAGDYFETLGIPLLLGRAITWEDARRQVPIVVVNEAYARTHWGDAGRALGRRIRYGGQPWREIVGVVKDVHDTGFEREPVPTVYWPLVVDGFWGIEPWTPRWFAFAVRTSRPDPIALLPDVRAVARGVDPAIPLFAVRTLDDIVRRSTARTTLTMSLLAIAALVALSLATVGIYAVVTYSVGRRTREIGLRLALGADAAGVRRLVVRQGLVLVLIGVAGGLTGSLTLAGFVSSLLFGVRPLDPATYLAASMGTVLVAVVATWLPALRASRMDPRTALTVE